MKDNCTLKFQPRNGESSSSATLGAAAVFGSVFAATTSRLASTTKRSEFHVRTAANSTTAAGSSAICVDAAAGAAEFQCHVDTATSFDASTSSPIQRSSDAPGRPVVQCSTRRSFAAPLRRTTRPTESVSPTTHAVDGTTEHDAATERTQLPFGTPSTAGATSVPTDATTGTTQNGDTHAVATGPASTGPATTARDAAPATRIATSAPRNAPGHAPRTARTRTRARITSAARNAPGANGRHVARNATDGTRTHARPWISTQPRIRRRSGHAPGRTHGRLPASAGHAANGTHGTGVPRTRNAALGTRPTGQAIGC